jgi:hypothetical protein
MDVALVIILRIRPTSFELNLKTRTGKNSWSHLTLGLESDVMSIHCYRPIDATWDVKWAGEYIGTNFLFWNFQSSSTIQLNSTFLGVKNPMLNLLQHPVLGKWKHGPRSWRKTPKKMSNKCCEKSWGGDWTLDTVIYIQKGIDSYR